MSHYGNYEVELKPIKKMRLPRKLKKAIKLNRNMSLKKHNALYKFYKFVGNEIRISLWDLPKMNQSMFDKLTSASYRYQNQIFFNSGQDERIGKIGQRITFQS